MNKTEHIPPGYKPSPLGPIPNDWEVKKFHAISKIVRGASPRPAGDSRYFKGSFIPWLTVASLTNIPDSQIEVYETEGFLTEEGSKQSRKLEKSTLILSNSGATLGVAKILGIQCCANDGIAAFIDWNESLVDKLYAFYFLNTKTNYFREVVAPGNGQPNLNTDLIGIEHICFPPLTEQTAIASLLSTWDKAIQTTTRIIAQKEQRKKWLMQQLLSGKKRLKGFSGEWKEFKIGDVFDFVKSYSYSRDNLTYDNKEGKLLYIHYGDIHSEFENDVLDLQTEIKIPYLKDEFSNDNEFHLLKDGDIIIADASEDYDGVGESIEIKNIKNKKIIAGLHTIVLRDNNSITSSDFRASLFNGEVVLNKLRKLATGSSVYGISKQSIESLSIIIPTIEEQTAIALVLQAVDKEIQLLKTKAIKLKEQKRGLMQVLLTGKKRLKT